MPDASDNDEFVLIWDDLELLIEPESLLPEGRDRYEVVRGWEKTRQTAIALLEERVRKAQCQIDALKATKTFLEFRHREAGGRVLDE